MSKIGKQPIKIPDGVTVEAKDGMIHVKGTRGELVIPLLHGINSEIKDGELRFTLADETKQARSNWGTVRALAKNAIDGLTKGFEKSLILEGVGFKVAKEGNDLVMSLGFSHPVRFPAVQGVTFEVEKNSIVRIKGFDKALVGEVAARIRALKKPEPYKGKGFRYSDEIIKRKVGKKAAATTGAAAA